MDTAKNLATIQSGADMRAIKSRLTRLLAVNISVLLLLLGSTIGVAEAHVLKEDNGISAVLHIPPEDNPAAAQPTELDLSFGDAKDAFTLQDCNCGVTVKSSGKAIQQVALQPALAGATLDATATVQFPTAGVYDVIVQGSAKNVSFNSFSLDYLVRVATSANGSTTNGTGGSDAVTIGAGSLIILVMIAYTAISRGGRYRTVSKAKHTTSVRRKKP